MVFLSAERVCQAVVGDIHEQIDIVTSYRFQYFTLCLTGSKAWNTGLYNIRIALISCKRKRVFVLTLTLSPPSDKIFVHLVSKLLAAAQRNDA